MQLCSDVKRLCTSLQDLVTLRRKKAIKRQLQISEPLNFKKEVTSLPGLSEDEISVLREQAAATRVGIADNRQQVMSFMQLNTLPDTRPTTSASASSLLDFSTSSRYPLSSTGASAMSMSTRSLNRLALPSLTSGSLSIPVSPVSTLGSGEVDDFQLGSPVSPLSPRGGSPNSVKMRMI